MKDRRVGLIVDGKLTRTGRVYTGMPQGSSIFRLLFLIYRSPLYSLIKEMGRKVIGFIDDITIYLPNRDQDKSIKKLGEILQSALNGHSTTTRH